MSSSRHLRPDSPSGRRFQDPARASTSALYDNYTTPSNCTTRETYASPRSSDSRVVPISKETYVNGKLVDTSRDSKVLYDSGPSDRHHSRRSTYDHDPRPSPASSTYLKPAAVTHGDRGVSADRTSTYDDRYSVSSSSAPRKEQRHIYSIDDGKAVRVSNDADVRRRDDRIEKLKQAPADRSKPYHLRGSSKGSTSEAPMYEYTDARGMFDTTQPKRQTRRGSVDAVRERPSSTAEPYQTAPRTSVRGSGPPVSTRGFDNVNNNYLSRTSSLQGPYKRSPSRTRGYTTSSSQVSDDENYRVPPRIVTTRDDSTHYPSPRSAGLTSPTRGGADDYYEPRRRSRFEDSGVASRGFGIRAPSVDARSSGESLEPRLMIEPAPAPRRDYPLEPRAATRDEPRLRDPDFRGHEHHPEDDRDNLAPRERDLPRERDQEPFRERDPIRDRDRDTAPPEGDRDSKLRDNHKTSEEPRREREWDYTRERDRPRPERERDYDRYSDDDRRLNEKRAERDHYDDDRRERDRRELRDEPDHHDHHHAAEAIAGTAAAGAAVAGVKGVHEKRTNDDKRAVLDDREADRKPNAAVRDTRSAPPVPREEPRNDRTQSDREGRKYEEDEDPDAPRRRHYVTKDKASETFASMPSKHSESLDPEEDYRRRVQQVQQEMGRGQSSQVHDDDQAERAERERRRKEREEAREAERRREAQAQAGATSDHTADAQALTRYASRENEIIESPASDEHSETSDTSEQKRKKRVSIVEPPKEQKAPKSILRKPTDKFPEEVNPIREGVAPLKDAKAAGDKSIPVDARWTKIPRSIVNPEALEEKGERFEERDEFVVILRVLTKEQVQKFADRTKELRGRHA